MNHVTTSRYIPAIDELPHVKKPWKEMQWQKEGKDRSSSPGNTNINNAGVKTHQFAYWEDIGRRNPQWVLDSKEDVHGNSSNPRKFYNGQC